MIDMVRSSNIKWKEDLERKKKERLDVLDAERKKKRTAALVKELESKKQKLMEDTQLQVEGLQRTLDKVENEKSELKAEVVELKAEVVELKQNLAMAQQNAQPRVQQTDTGSIVTASGNDALSTTPVLSLSVEANGPSDDSRAAYFLDAARKIYGVRAKLIRQIWENETIIRTSVVKENWKQQMAKTVKVLQGCNEDTLKESERLDHFLQTQAAKRLAAKEKLEALHNERRRNFECSKDLLDEASCCRLLGGTPPNQPDEARRSHRASALGLRSRQRFEPGLNLSSC
ncbi:hypothetical protein HPB51_010589 [Rhipicephalus microplus]|uniref:Uncharacterized protein n=1 Tax=Rhipicephalus microplus TaxID=6941 RepID=A0A9J6E8L8_RHIMP|nr:hypothetical protein HPB51_010589 [Rhipicephalus microplus]